METGFNRNAPHSYGVSGSAAKKEGIVHKLCSVVCTGCLWECGVHSWVGVATPLWNSSCRAVSRGGRPRLTFANQVSLKSRVIRLRNEC